MNTDERLELSSPWRARVLRVQEEVSNNKESTKAEQRKGN